MASTSLCAGSRGLVGGLLICITAVGLAACKPSGPPAIRLGVDRGLEPLGLARFLVTGFEDKHGDRVDIRYGGADELVMWANQGELDVVLVVSEGALDALEAEGLPVRAQTYAHEELVLIGPFEDMLGRHAKEKGAELLKSIARTNYRYIKAKPGSVERTRHDRLFRETRDRAEPGSFFDTDVDGLAFVERAIEDNAFAFVKRSSLLQAVRAGKRPHRVYKERDPALVVRLVLAEIHPAKTKRPSRPELFDYVMGEDGSEAVKAFGADRFGYPLFAASAPQEGKGARVPDLKAEGRASRE